MSSLLNASTPSTAAWVREVVCL